jgi:hypothetical protein
VEWGGWVGAGVRESLVVGFVGGHVVVLVEVQDHQGQVAPVEFVQPLAALAVALQELDFLAHHPDRTLDPVEMSAAAPMTNVRTGGGAA